MGACDIGKESAYRCKLTELSPGTSGGLLYFVPDKGSAKVIRYYSLRNNIPKTFPS